MNSREPAGVSPLREARARAAIGPAWQRPGCVYVVGVDAMTMDAIGPLARSGELPHFTRLMAEGCYGVTETIDPCQSSLIWTTIATGRHHSVHGIHAFDYFRLLRMGISKLTIQRLNRTGLKLPLRVLGSMGLLTRHFHTARDVRAKAIWDIVSEAGERVGVVGWPVTWPAYPVNGFLVSDRHCSRWRMKRLGIEEVPEARFTYPDELEGELEELIVTPEGVPMELLQRYVPLPEAELAKLLAAEFVKGRVESELRFCVSSDVSLWRVFERCLDRFAPLRLAMVMFWAMDKIQHAAYSYLPWADATTVPDEDRARFGRVVPESYTRVDRGIGMVMERMREDDSLVVFSDHGVGFEPERASYGHKRARPPGVFFALGKEFLPGHKLAGAHVRDLMPTLLRILGFPVARDLVGRPLEEALTPEFRAEHPAPAPIPTYGSRTANYSALP